MVDTSQSPALGVMVTVPDRTARTLLPVMQRHLRNGTIIIVQSDSWSAYRQVQQLPSVAQHDMVNHSLNFVDPVTGVHTQNVESYWNRVKTKFKRMKGGFMRLCCHHTWMSSCGVNDTAQVHHVF